MAQVNETKEAIKKLEAELKKINKKTFKVLFFVPDSKGSATGSLTYIYETAYQLKEMGYNVQILYADKDFVGVESWLGEKYAKLPHFNIDKDHVDISPADILFIPEIYGAVMSKTKHLPCKRIGIVQNMAYLYENTPVGITYEDMGIHECIVTTDNVEKDLLSVFPKIRTHKVSPSISNIFTNDNEDEKKLIINIVAKNPSDVYAIVKPFMWKYPMYKWVAFRDLKGVSKENFATALKESFATVWVDDTTDFGYSALEAMACGNIVIAKAPESNLEWMYDDKNGIKDNALWFINTKDCHDIIAGVIESYLHEDVPSIIAETASETLKDYTPARQSEDIKTVYVDTIFKERETELTNALSIVKSKLETENK